MNDDAYEQLDWWIITGDGRRHWVAILMDKLTGQRYAGEGATVWEAVAWSLDERAHRRHGIVRMCVALGAKPTLTPDPALVERARIEREKRDAAQAEREAVRLPLIGAPCTKSKGAAARRARSKKSGAKPGASH